MTESLENIQRRLHGATDIHGIFGAMRAMAAVRLQEAQAALPGTRAYADTIAEALAEALALEPAMPPAPAMPRAPAQRPLLLVFMPEHGFVGALAERLLERAMEHPDVGTLVVVGDRGADLAEQHGLAVHERLALGAHVEAGPSIARRIANVVETLIANGRADAADILFPRYSGAGSARLVERRLLPLDPRALPEVRGYPLVNLPVADLIDAVLSEWVLGELAHAVVETLASENGARLLAMDAARSSVESKLAGLQAAYRIARQEAITSEIAEVVAGVLAQEPGRATRTD